MSATVLLVGAGAVGARAARQLVDTPGIERVLVCGRRAERVHAVADAMGAVAEAIDWGPGRAVPAGVGVIACAVPAAVGGLVARVAIQAGIPSASAVDDTQDLLTLDAAATSAGVTVAAGCGLAPGMTDVLARHAADALESVDEIGVARAGAAGDACTTSLRIALRDRPGELRDGRYEEPRRRGGHELVWFPDPVGVRECESVATGVHLLARSFPGIERVTVRVGAPDAGTRFPWPRRDDGDGSWGAVRVEVWGKRGVARELIVYGVIERTAIAAGTVLGVTTAALAGVRPGLLRAQPGVHGLATLAEPRAFLAELAGRGVKAAVFEGVPVA